METIEPTASLLDDISVPKTYTRLAIAGMILILLWGAAFAGYRLWTGRWPMQPAPMEKSPFLPKTHSAETSTDSDAVK